MIPTANPVRTAPACLNDLYTVPRRVFMSLTSLSPDRLRRRFLAMVLPACVGLALAGLPAATLPQAHAQAPQRFKAPDFDGATGFLGTDKPIKLKDLRGKIVILDFWTLC
jgi:hypothetical protein